jgi:hypothetical protein
VPEAYGFVGIHTADRWKTGRQQHFVVYKLEASIRLGISGSKRGACKVVRFITQTINVMGGFLSEKKQYTERKHYMTLTLPAD